MRINTGLFLATLGVLIFVLFNDATGTYLEYARTGTVVFLLTALLGILINRVFKSAFLELHNIVLVVFFVLRIPFAYSENVISDIFIRSVELGNIERSLYALSLQVLIFITCIVGFLPHNIFFTSVSFSNEQIAKILRVTLLILGINAFNILFLLRLGENSLPNVIAIFFAIFNYASLLLFLVPTMLLIDKGIKRKYKINLYLQLVAIVALVLISGSKSGLFQVFAVYIVSALVIKGYDYKISTKGFVAGTILLSVAIILFMLGTVVNKIQRGMVDKTEWSGLVEVAFEDFSIVMNSVSYRIGYLDFYIDKFTQTVYHNAFSVDLYIKAFIDAITPGFDVFHVPLVSRAVFNNFFNGSEGPNSEVVTVFGEAQLLAGYFSFIVYLFIILVLQVILRYKGKSPFENVINMIFISYAFYRYLLGFGVDYWLFGDVLYPYIFVRCMLHFIQKKQDENFSQMDVTTLV